MKIACKSHVKLQLHEVGSDPLRSWPRTVHTHTQPRIGALQANFDSNCRIRSLCGAADVASTEHSAKNSATVVCRGSLVLVGQSTRLVTEITETNALRIGAIHLYCGTSTDQDRSIYAHMGMGIFDLHGNNGSTCCKEQGGPSRIGERPPSPGLLCMRSHFRWLPLLPSTPPRKLSAAIAKKSRGAIDKPCC